jgi:hypothetical protein
MTGINTFTCVVLHEVLVWYEPPRHRSHGSLQDVPVYGIPWAVPSSVVGLLMHSATNTVQDVFACPIEGLCRIHAMQSAKRRRESHEIVFPAP